MKFDLQGFRYTNVTLYNSQNSNYIWIMQYNES